MCSCWSCTQTRAVASCSAVITSSRRSWVVQLVWGMSYSIMLCTKQCHVIVLCCILWQLSEQFEGDFAALQARISTTTATANNKKQQSYSYNKGAQPQAHFDLLHRECSCLFSALLLYRYCCTYCCWEPHKYHRTKALFADTACSMPLLP